MELCHKGVSQYSLGFVSVRFSPTNRFQARVQPGSALSIHMRDFVII